jgi:hypothetical protein
LKLRPFEVSMWPAGFGALLLLLLLPAGLPALRLQLAALSLVKTALRGHDATESVQQIGAAFWECAAVL